MKNVKSDLLRILLLSSLLIVSIFGGYLIGAVDPFFGFKYYDISGADSTASRTIDTRLLKLGADSIQFTDLPGSHPGAGYDFFLNGRAIARLSGNHPMYVGLLDFDRSGTPVVLCSVRHSADTGVWKIDPSVVKPTFNIDDPTTWTGRRPGRGALRRVPDTVLSQAILDFAGYLSNDIIYVPLLSVALIIHLVVLAIRVASLLALTYSTRAINRVSR